MRQFYKISIDGDQKGTFSVRRDESGNFDIRELWRGIPFHGSLPHELKFYVNEGDSPAYLANLITPICNHRLMQIIQKRAGKDAQFFPAPVLKQKNGEPVSGYYLLNVAKQVECLDEGRSEIIYMNDDDGNETTEIGAVTHIVVREERVPETAHLFRLAECLPIIIISEELYEAMLPIEQWPGLAVNPCETSWSG